MEADLATHDRATPSQPQQDKLPTGGRAGMKQCPYCAEQIRAQAIKCRYCGEFLDGSRPAGRRPRPKQWYFATPTVVLALLCLGPLALPLVWLNPRYKPTTKIIVTLIVLVVTVACMYLVTVTYKLLLDQLRVLRG